jgi:hypothetical protein
MIAHPIEIEPSDHVEPDRSSSRPEIFQNIRAVSEPRAKRPLPQLRRPGDLDYQQSKAQTGSGLQQVL